MEKVIIGLIGETGSGKDTFCERIKKTVEEPVFCFRFSDPLSEILMIIFSEIKKEEQQWLVALLRERFGENVLGDIIVRRIKEVDKGLVILNGVRMPQEVKMLKAMGGKTVYITADSKTRWERVSRRAEKKDDPSSYEEFLGKEKAKSEIKISEIGKKADIKIENNGSIEDFYKKIDTVIKSFK